MPVKIKNILNGKVEIVDVRESKNREKYPSNMWQVVARKDIVHIYEPKQNERTGYIDRGEHEKKDLEAELTGHPNYSFKDVPDRGNWEEFIFTQKEENNQSLEPVRETGNLLPINTPKAYTIINKTKTTIDKYKNNIWTVTIIGGLIVLILGTVFLKLAGVIR